MVIGHKTLTALYIHSKAWLLSLPQRIASKQTNNNGGMRRAKWKKLHPQFQRLKVNFSRDLSWDKKQSTLFLEESTLTYWEWVQMPKLKQIERVMLLMRGEYWTVHMNADASSLFRDSLLHDSVCWLCAWSPRRKCTYYILPATPINRRSVHIYMCIVSAPVCLCIICLMNRKWLRQTPPPEANIYIALCTYAITIIINSERLFFAPLNSANGLEEIHFFVKSVFDSCGDDDPRPSMMRFDWQLAHLAHGAAQGYGRKEAHCCGGGGLTHSRSFSSRERERIIERNANLLGIDFQDGELHTWARAPRVCHGRKFKILLHTHQ